MIRNRPGTPLWDVFTLDEDGELHPKGAIWDEP